MENRLKEILALQMLDSLNQLHEKDVVHRDIKSDNFLIKHNNTNSGLPFTIKLSDLGLAS